MLLLQGAVAASPQRGYALPPMHSGGVPVHAVVSVLRRSKMLPVIVAMLFVVAILVVAAYALVRPWTHTHYEHPSEKLWRPLD
jgi:hypothetical protein